MSKDLVKTNRREFIKLATAAGGVLATMHVTGTPIFAAPVAAKVYIPLVKLPYPTNALAPDISEKTVKQHYNDHHMAYYNQLTGYIKANPDYDKIPLDKLLVKTKGGILLEDSMFNMGILLWNHNFYWQSMKPKGGIKPKGALTKKIIESFRSVENFKKKFIDMTMEMGIGWVWLVKTGEKLNVVRTMYNDGLITSKHKPLITIDVWEHAYYMDYGANRKKYVENYLNNLVNWDFAEANFKGIESMKPKVIKKEPAQKKEKTDTKKGEPK